MRDLRELDAYRNREWERRVYPGPNPDPENVGCFRVRRSTMDIAVMAAAGGGWDHVSVSTPSRCPTWAEMDVVKRLFFRDDETAMQLHVPVAQHKNHHPYCLHLWRPHYQDIPRPDPIMVAL